MVGAISLAPNVSAWDGDSNPVLNQLGSSNMIVLVAYEQLQNSFQAIRGANDSLVIVT
jgi:hypothetical protein